MEPNCRICLEPSSEDEIKKEVLISPCLCKGTMKWVHQDCLVKMVDSSKSVKCGTCRTVFTYEEVKESIWMHYFRIFKLINAFLTMGAFYLTTIIVKIGVMEKIFQRNLVFIAIPCIEIFNFISTYIFVYNDTKKRAPPIFRSGDDSYWFYLIKMVGFLLISWWLSQLMTIVFGVVWYWRTILLLYITILFNFITILFNFITNFVGHLLKIIYHQSLALIQYSLFKEKEMDQTECSVLVPFFLIIVLIVSGLLFKIVNDQNFMRSTRPDLYLKKRFSNYPEADQSKKDS